MTPFHCKLKTGQRAGFSLLEVLVACGILVIGLASIAAILPAAGSRLGEASAQDRAIAAAAVAMSEIQCRGLVSRQLLPTGTWVGGPAFSPSAIIFGETLSLAVTSSATSSGYATTTGSLALTATSGSVSLATGGTTAIQAFLSGTLPVLSVPVPSILNSRINNDIASADRRGFILEDEVQYLPSVTGDLPANSFVNGVRQFNRGVCWGALMTPTPAGASWATANAAKVSVAVFRKPGGMATAMTLTSSTTGFAAATGIFQITAPASLQRTILKPCSNVLAVGPAVAPQWLAIRSSWISGTNPLTTLASATTCVTFENPALVGPLVIGNTLTVIGFENLLLVNEQTLPIQ